MQQIVCPKCKARVDASLNFCPGCGSALPLPNSRGGNSGGKLTQVNQQHVANAILNEGKKRKRILRFHWLWVLLQQFLL